MFQSLTGLRVREFEHLLVDILPMYQAAEIKRLSRPDRQRAIGGGTGDLSAPTATVERAPINSDGSLGAWAPQASLSIPRSYAVAIVVGDRLVVMGGFNGSSILDSVEVARIGEAGTLGPWQAAAPLRVPRYGAGSFAADRYLYLVEGVAPPGCPSAGNCNVLLEVDRFDGAAFP